MIWDLEFGMFVVCCLLFVVWMLDVCCLVNLKLGNLETWQHVWLLMNK